MVIISLFNQKRLQYFFFLYQKFNIQTYIHVRTYILIFFSPIIEEFYFFYFYNGFAEYDIENDRDFLEDMVKKSRDPKDKVYAEMLLQNKSIRDACENPFTSGGWHRRNSAATRRISVISEISLSFVYGKQLSITEIEENHDEY